MLIYLFPVFIFIILYFPVSLKIEYQRKEEGDGFNLDLYTYLEVFGFPVQFPYLKNRILLFLLELISEIDYFFISFRKNEIENELEEMIKLNNRQIEKIKKAISFFRNRKFMGIIIRSLRIKCLKFYWETSYGAADPACTAVLYGFIWALKGIIIRTCDELLGLKRGVEVSVNPDFYKLKLTTRFTGIFVTRLGNIIITILIIILLKIKTTVTLTGFFSLK